MADIVDIAISAGNFKTLVTAVQAAGLVDTLKSPGPFTVFAPTDEAFGKLPAGTVDGLLKDIPKLKSILTYHVVSGKVTLADVAKLKTAKTVEGEDVKVDAHRWHGHSLPKINDANIVKADIMADNGVIHVIDKVLMPPMEMAH
ncbi:MAG: fasciclin domain-containing protein [Candidatus Bathyarchaeota archaeon]|nr:fasciclin domain-containing protein [Candidatus Bathyarchaeota archaeon]